MAAGYSDPTIKFEKKFSTVNQKILEPYELVKHESSGNLGTNRTQHKLQ